MTYTLINFMPLIIIIPARTCQSLGLNPGCCSLASSTCYVPAATCYCDPSCHTEEDCCFDVTLTQCLARTQSMSQRGETRSSAEKLTEKHVGPPSFSMPFAECWELESGHNLSVKIMHVIILIYAVKNMGAQKARSLVSPYLS